MTADRLTAAEVVRRVEHLRYDQGLSLHQIVDVLDSEGEPGWTPRRVCLALGWMLTRDPE